MGLSPRLASGPRLGTIPLPERRPSIAEGAGAIVDALSNARERDRQVARREEEIAHEIAMRDQREAENLSIATNAARLANDQVSLGEHIEQLRSSAAPGAVGHDKAVKQLVDEWADGFWAEVGPSERVRTHFITPTAELTANIQQKELAWARQQSAKAQGEGVQALIDAGARAVMAAPNDAETFNAQVKASDAVIDGMVADPDRKAAVRKLRDQQLRSALFDGHENTGNFAAMRRLAGDARFMSPFDKDYTDNVLDRATGVEKAQRVAAEAAAADAEEKAKNALDALDETIAQGGVVSQKDAAAAIATARGAKVPEEHIIAFQGKLATQSVNRQFGPAADPDGSKGRAQLMQLNRTAAQRPLTSDENMLHERLTAVQGKRRSDDAALLKPMANKTAAGDLAVLAELQGRSRDERFAVAEEIRPGLGFVGLLDGATRQAALEGFYDLKANPDLLKVKRGQQGGMTDPTKAAFRAHLGATAGQIPESAVEAYRGVANAIYAKVQKDAGQSGWDPALYAHAANKAMGARRGGDGVWRGGLGLVQNRHVWLPDWASARELEAFFAREPFTQATYDGKRPAAKADVLANFTPILEQGGSAGEAAVYSFVNAAGQELKRKDNGQSYRLVLHPGAR